MSGDTPTTEPEWLTLDQLAERIGADRSKVRQLVRDQRLVTVRRNGADVVPAAFVSDGRLLRGLEGLTTLLLDAGFGAEESLEWMFAEDDSLGASPVQALTQGRPKEVKRLAQLLA